MKRWMLACFATLSLLMIVAGSVASPAAAAPGGNAENAKACQKGGWETLARAGDAGTPFLSQGACVSYGAQGGTIVRYVPLVVSTGTVTLTWLTWDPTDTTYCYPVVSVTDFTPDGTYDVYLSASLAYPGSPAGSIVVTGGVGTWSSTFINGPATWYASVNGISALPSTPVC